MDGIEKKIVLEAPRERVWRALTDSREFGIWFGARWQGPFVAGQPLKGEIQPTQIDPEVAKLQQPHAGTKMTIEVGELVPMKRFSFRWYPFGEKEVMTQVTFTLEDAPGGILLTVTETGFRRRESFEANDSGWAHQLKLIEGYLARHG